MASPSPSRTPLAGGFLIAASITIGVIIGAFKGQPSIGFVVGAGAGVAMALMLWIIDRQKG